MFAHLLDVLANPVGYFSERVRAPLRVCHTRCTHTGVTDFVKSVLLGMGTRQPHPLPTPALDLTLSGILASGGVKRAVAVSF